MREAERRHIFVFQSKAAELRYNIRQLQLYELESLVHNHNVCIISDIAACRSHVDYSFSRRTLHSIRIHMAHNIMANLFFSLLCYVIINILCMSAQLVQLLLGYGQTKLALRLSQGYPKLTPRAELYLIRKYMRHLIRSISRYQWVFVFFLHYFSFGSDAPTTSCFR